MWKDGSQAPAPRGNCSRKPRCADPPASVPASPAQLPAICLVPSILLLCISMMLPFSSPNLYILQLFRKMLLKCHLFQSCEATNRDWLYQKLQFTQSSNWGLLLPTTPPHLPQTSALWGAFYASYNKPALNINAHFRCIWHFQAAWIENLGKMLQWSNCRRNTLLFLLLIRNKTQVRPYCSLIRY